MSSSLEDARNYCLAALKEASRDHYLACLLMPETVRHDMAALYLFDVETARIRDRIHEPMPGEIRLQWWRDVLQDKSDRQGSGPLAYLLKDVIGRHKLPLKPLEDLLDARVFDLYDDAMGSVEDFELYAGETASSIIQLGLLICDPENARKNAVAAGHAGVAATVAKVLRNLPSHIRRGQVYFPSPMLAAAGLDRDAFQNLDKSRRQVSTTVEIFASYGLDHLARARAAFDRTKPGMPPFLLSAVCALDLKAAKSKSGAVADGKTLSGPLAHQWALWRCSAKRRF